MDFSQLELIFADGDCAVLAKHLNEKYGWKIFHILVDVEDEIPYVTHTLVYVPDIDKYFDVYGYHSEAELITFWYYELGLMRNDAKISITTSINLDPNLLCDVIYTPRTEIPVDVESCALFLLENYKGGKRCKDYDWQNKKFI